MPKVKKVPEPTAGPHWSKPQRRLLRAAALQVRILSFAQIYKLFFPEVDKSECKIALWELEAVGLLASDICEVHPLLELKQPVFCWEPGEPTPGKDTFSELADVLSNRWLSEATTLRVYFATKRLANLFGSRSHGLPRDVEQTHDLHMTEVFCRYSNRHASWIGECAFDKLGFRIKGMKDPDAFLVDEMNKATRVVEFAGKYPVDHLLNFHRHCAGKAYECAKRSGLAGLSLYRPEGTSYELW